jgi:acyl carrier protein
MGLDSVELVMAVEERFDISIPDAVAAKLTTVGLLQDCVVAELRRLGRTDILAMDVLSLLRGIICKQLGVKPHEVVPSARFVEDLRID